MEALYQMSYSPTFEERKIGKMIRLFDSLTSFVRSESFTSA